MTSTPPSGTRTTPDTTPDHQTPEQVPLIARTLLFDDPTHTSPTLSPDGRWLAWLAPRGSVLNVWARLMADPDSARPLTADTGRGVEDCTWAPDGVHILFHTDARGDEQFVLHAVHLHTGQIRALTPDGAQAGILAISHRDPDHILISLNDRNPQFSEAYHLTVADGTRARVCDNDDRTDFAMLVADQRMRVRAAVRFNPDGGLSILVRDTLDTPWRELLRVDADDAGATKPIGFDQDDRRLLCWSPVGADTTRLLGIDLATGDHQTLASDPTYDMAHRAGLLTDPATGAPQIAYVQRERLEPVVLNPDLAADVARVAALADDEVQILGGDLANRTWLLRLSRDNAPARYSSYDRSGGTLTLLFDSRPELMSPRHRLATMQPFALTARDGVPLHGYLHTPPGPARRRLPTVLLVHGGPAHRDVWGLDPMAQWLANRGYLVVQPNFRGSDGYGTAFRVAGYRQWGAAMQTDLLDTVDWVIEQGWVAPDRVAIMGGSYGGYAALVGAAFTPDVFACAVSIAGPTDLVSLVESIPPHWGSIRTHICRTVGDPQTEADSMRARSPLAHADQIRRPVMIAQATNDTAVPLTEAQQLVEALHRHGIPHTYILCEGEGEGHALAVPATRLHLIGQIEQFLAAHLGGGRVELPLPEAPPWVTVATLASATAPSA